MAFVNFICRADDQILYQDVLNVLHDEELSGYLIGDTVILTLEISREAATPLLGADTIPGVIVYEDNSCADLHNPKIDFFVDIEMRVTARKHHVYRDWINRHTIAPGFRPAGTEVTLQAVTAEGEEILIKTQKLYDEEKKGKLLPRSGRMADQLDTWEQPIPG